MAQAERQTGSGAMGQHPTCGGRFFTKRKNKGTKYPLAYRAGLMAPPCGMGAVGRENRGIYSLGHGGAVIPPLCSMGQGQE